MACLVASLHNACSGSPMRSQLGKNASISCSIFLSPTRIWFIHQHRAEDEFVEAKAEYQTHCKVPSYPPWAASCLKPWCAISWDGMEPSISWKCCHRAAWRDTHTTVSVCTRVNVNADWSALLLTHSHTHSPLSHLDLVPIATPQPPHLSSHSVFGREEWLAMINGDRASEPLHVTTLSDGLSLFSISPSASVGLTLLHIIFLFLTVFSFVYLLLITLLFSLSHLCLHSVLVHLVSFSISLSLFLPLLPCCGCAATCSRRWTEWGVPAPLVWDQIPTFTPLTETGIKWNEHACE